MPGVSLTLADVGAQKQTKECQLLVRSYSEKGMIKIAACKLAASGPIS